MKHIEDLLNRFRNKDKRALARMITLVENESEYISEILDKIYSSTGTAFRIGVTGPPGAGKSTLVDQLTKYYRKSGKTVGIIAIDPTSPFTGGALLGDRIRMGDISSDSGVFIRSMATRGSLGGMSQRSQETADLLDAFGFDIVIFETVGVGQSELDIVEAADTTIVVLVPEAGDSIQTMKAGLMEIADIFVINKSDREGADRIFVEINNMLELSHDSKLWKPPVHKSVASLGVGVEDVIKSLNTHFDHQNSTQVRSIKQRKRTEQSIHHIIRDELMKMFWDKSTVKNLDTEIENVLTKKRSPYSLSKDIVKQFIKNLQKQ